ncbi:hypothetical protein OIU78_002869 [Salix suchowensis]|nr:hypothetical protein OIU78_002869 [Salix suchowensis]
MAFSTYCKNRFLSKYYTRKRFCVSTVSYYRRKLWNITHAWSRLQSTNWDNTVPVGRLTSSTESRRSTRRAPA